MDVSDIDILELLPQRPPFILVDRMTEFSMEHSETEFLVKGDGPLDRDGCLSEAGLMENMAQSCAARIGYINKYILHKKVTIGIIGAVKDMKAHSLPEAGTLLTTSVDLLSEVFNITLVRVTVSSGSGPVASCEMKISLTDIEK